MLQNYLHYCHCQDLLPLNLVSTSLVIVFVVSAINHHLWFSPSPTAIQQARIVVTEESIGIDHLKVMFIRNNASVNIPMYPDNDLISPYQTVYKG